jgi:chromosome partitioning protein
MPRRAKTQVPEPASPRVIAVANQKGGVGKTTTVACLALLAARAGSRVLAVDIDPQASLTIYFGEDPRALDNSGRTTYALIRGDGDPNALVLGDNPALIPSSIRLASAESELVGEWNGATLLCDRLAAFAGRYDVILLDCSPSLGLLTVNALAAADAVLVPVKTDYLSLMGVGLLLETVDKVRTRLNPELAVMGVLPTMHDARNSHDREALEELGRLMEGRARLYPPIRRSTAFDQASVAGLPSLLASGPGKALDAYHPLVQEILDHGREAPEPQG